MNRISQTSFSLTLILALIASPLSAQTGAFSLADIRGAFQHIKIPDAGTNEFEFELELSEPVEEQEPPI